MKNTRALSLFAFFLAVLLFMPALAKAESFQVRVVVQDAVVRLKPEANSPVISTMPLGSVLESEEGTADWYKVTLPPDENGFVVIGYIQKSDTEMVSAAPVKQKQVAPARVAQPVVTSPQPRMPQVAPRPRTSGGMELGLRLSGGAGMLFGTNHINDFYQGFSDYWYDEELAGYSSSAVASGQLDPLKMGYLGGMEIFFNINPYIGVGLGFGYLTGKKDFATLSIVDEWDGYELEDSLMQKVSAIPLQMTFYGGVPLGNMMRIVPYLGVGYYIGRVTFENSYYWEDTWFGDWYEGLDSWTGTANAFGFHGGVNFDIYFTRNIGLFFGIGGVVATLKDLVGDLDWEYEELWWGTPFSESDTDVDQQFWFGEEQWWTSQYYPWTYFDDEKPSSPWTRNVESGKISLSHFRLVIGFVVYLMR